DDPIAYVCGGSWGLSIVDVSNPAAPARIDSIGTGGVAGRVTRTAALSGGLLALAEGDAGIRLADVTDPSDPVLLGSYDPGDYAIDVAFSGTGELYVLLRSTGLLVLDVTDPESPDSIGFLEIDAFLLRNVEKLAGVLYVTETRGIIDPGFVHVVSIADPRDPSPLLRIQSQGSPGSLAMGSQRAYVAAGFGGFEIFGTFEDYGFLSVGSYDPYAPIDVVAASETRVLAADRDGNLWPFYLQEGEALSHGEPYDLGSPAADLALQGSRGFVSIVGESLLAEVFLPTPDLVHFVRFVELPGEASGLAIRDTLLYVALLYDGFGVYSIARPEAVVPLGFFRSGGTEVSDLAGAGADRIALTGNVACVGTRDRTRGLFLLDVAEPTAPGFLGMYPNDRRVLEVGAYSGYAYLGQRVVGTAIVDVRDPVDPTFVVERPDMYFVRRMCVADDYLFAARRAEGIDIYSLFNPENPQRVWRAATPDAAADLAIFGTYLASADGSAFRMYRQDFVNADQTAPGYTIGVLSNPFANAFVDFVVVASEALIDKPTIRFTMGEVDSLLPVYRLDTPRNVYHAAYRLTEIGTGAVRVAGEDLAGNKSETNKAFSVSYVRGSKGGSIYSTSGKVEVRIPPRGGGGDSYVLLADVDRSEVEGQHAGRLPLPVLGPFRVSLGAADGPVAVLVREVPIDPESGAPSLFRLEEDTWVVCATEYDPSSGILRSDLPGSSVFLLSHEAEASAPAPFALRLDPNRPNPFNPRTSLVFSLSKESRARLSIYDVSGRLVQNVADGVFAAGSHTVVWDGRDQSGRPAASGVYFARVEASGLAEARKIVLLR
ncbi:MAG: FlgD immunoglobulin-like domain containing protein, partial [Candidatus Eisenbacteria bacterium]